MCPRCGARLVYGIGCLAHGWPSDAPTAEPIQDREAHRTWSDADWDTALEARGRLTSKGIAAELGRTPKAVKNQLRRHGYHIPRVGGQARRRVESPTESRHYRHYSEEEKWAIESGELQRLRQQRTTCAVYHAMYRMVGPMREADGCLSIREAARIYGMEEWTVRRMVNRGTLPAQRVSTRMVRIDPLDAERILSPLAHPLPAPDYRGAGSPMRAKEIKR